MSVDARAFLKDLHRLTFQDIPAEVRNAMVECVKEAERDAKSTSLFNDKTGMLRKKIIGDVTSNTTGEVSANTSYARFVENGTPRHDIRGNPLLQFKWNGVRVTYRRVDHPGTAPRPFMEHAGKRGEETLHDALSAYTDDAIRRFNA